MSNSVWYKEVDTALYKLIRKLIDPDIQVFFNTERDLIKEPPKYPYARILHLGEQFAFKRYDPSKQVIDIDTESGFITMEDSALPYDLNYQVELISNSNNLHHTTSLKWASKVRPFFTLQVIDNGGTKRHCFVSATRPVTIDEQSQDDKTTFRYIIRLKVRVELDENTPTTTKLVNKRINLNI